MAHEDQRVSNPEYMMEHPVFFLDVKSVYLILFLQDVIRKAVGDKTRTEKERKEREKKAAVMSGQRSALDRFKK